VVIVKVLHAANVDGKKFGSRKVWLTSYDHQLGNKQNKVVFYSIKKRFS
jgi:hypothetical protein